MLARDSQSTLTGTGKCTELFRLTASRHNAYCNFTLYLRFRTKTRSHVQQAAIDLRQRIDRTYLLETLVLV